MAYVVKWTSESQHDLKNLERDTIIRIIQRVERIKENPFVYLKKLVGKPEWRLRIGDYRVLIDFDQKNEILSVLKVGHRKNIYDF